MRFALTDEQRAFAASLDKLLTAADTPAVNRAWAQGDTEPGQALWSRLAEQGVAALLVPEEAAEMDAGPVELAAAFEVLGHHAVPLPEGSLPRASERDGDGLDQAHLAVSAYLLGAGERLLADSVGYVLQRRQFGRPIGSYQAVKHSLADVRIALDFARPLVFGAACAPTPRAVAAAMAGASDAAHLASRTALQVHGAIGYTLECDLSVWMLRVLDLRAAWGTPRWHRERVLASLLAERAEGSRT